MEDLQEGALPFEYEREREMTDEEAQQVLTVARPLLPTMSKGGLLLACQWPFRRKVPVVPAGEAADYGTAFHAVMADLLGPKTRTRKGRDKFIRKIAKIFRVDVEELHRNVKHAWPVLRDWLRGDNPWSADLSRGVRFRVELPLAYAPKTEKGRIIRPHNSEHVYEDAKKSEMGGTADLIIDMIPDRARKKGVPHLIVIDHKTGFEFEPPQDSAQLLTIGKAYSSIVPYEGREIALAVFHAPREGAPTVYASEVEPHEFRAHAKAMRRAWARIGDGSLRPGPHCARCQAMTICPAYENALVALKPKGKITSAQIGKIHQTLSTFKSFAKRIHNEILVPWVRLHGPAPRPDGKVAALVPRKYEMLSKSSVIRALGEEGGTAKLDELRDLGCLETQERHELRGVADK